MSSKASSDLLFTGGALTRPLTVRRHARARTMRLVVDPRDGTVRLTLPPRAALRPALAWAEEKRGWIEAALAKVRVAAPLGDGATLPFEGRDLTIRWSPDHGRRVRVEGDVLFVGGPPESLAPRIIRWLRAESLARFDALTRKMAVQAGVSIGRVSIGDPKSRWGSCAGSGDIRYSWRLIMAPPAVLESVVAHEVAHRLHMDHSPSFHAAALRLLGREPKAERAWLRANGAALHRVG
ncbi:M48 family metallopeptidase [Sphingomonas sp. ID0503]|uniref:M48 family metallopeptidase n=1 Tax=Sphingomonas sp. ID0503 TaxID=3399691 RepID=UPI003AFA17CA